MLKGIFKDSHPIVQFLMVLVFVFGGAIAGEFTGLVVIFLKYGFSMEIAPSLIENLEAYPSALRELQFFASLGTFVFPSLILAYLFSDNYKTYLKIDMPVYFSISMLAILSMLVVSPFMNFIAYYNHQLHFPEFLKPLEDILRTQEDANQSLSETMLNAEDFWALILNIVVIGIFAAVGEEFLFRGVFQNIFGRFIRNKHLVIWIVAIVFSLAHFQFFGFIPRVLLGAYLGYLVLYTRNMWIPVMAHFTNNFFVILVYWNYRDEPEMLKNIDGVGTGSMWWVALLSLILFGLIFWMIRKQSHALQNLSS